MTDNLANSYVERKEQDEEQIRKRMARLDFSQAVSPSPTAPTSSEGEGSGVMDDIMGGISDAPRQILGGARDAVQEVGDLIDSAWDWAGENIEMLHDVHAAAPDVPDLPEVAESDTVTGGIIRTTSQFLTGFIPALKGAKALGMGSKLAGFAAGAAADAAVFDPLDVRLSNLIQDVPILQNPVTDFLASSPDDSEAEGRFKNALEGAALGGLTEGLVGAFKAYRGAKVAAGVDPSKVQYTRDMPRLGADPDALVGKTEKKFKLKVREGAAERLLAGDYTMDEIFEDFNWSRMRSEEDIETAMRMVTEEFHPDMLKAKGKGDWASAESLAKLIGADPKNAEKLFYGAEGLGTNEMTAKVFAMRSFLVDSSQEFVKLRDAVLQGDSDPIAFLKFKEHAVRHAGLQQQFSGIKTNLARGLNAFRRVTGDELVNVPAHELDLLLDSQGGMKAIRTFAQKHAWFEDDVLRNKFTRDAAKATTTDKILFYWTNSILSGPSTHAVNITSNALALGMDVIETSVAGFKNSFMGGQGEVTFREAAARMQGMFASGWDALKMAGKAFVKGDSLIDASTKLEYRQNAISAEGFGWSGTAGKFADYLGNAVGLPGRALITSDEFFKTIAIRSEAYAQAARMSAQDGVPMKDLLDLWLKKGEMPQNIADEALKKAKLVTFQEDLGKGGQSFMRFLNENKVLKFAVPFVRTPVNIVKYVGRRTPLINRFSESVKADIAAGGARAELAQARVATGTMLYGVGTMLASQGYITGGASIEEKNANQLLNRQSYALKIGDKQYSFARLDPFGIFLGLCADMVELAPHMSDPDYDEFTSAAIMMGSKYLFNKTYLRGLSDALAAIGDPKKNGAWWAQNFASSFVPNFFNQINRSEFDQEIKEVHDMRDAIMRKLPWASAGVYPKRNQITGEPMLYGDSGFGGMLPTYVSKESKEPSLHEIKRLGLRIGDVPSTIKQVPVDAKEYDDLMQTITKVKDANGLDLLKHLNTLVNSPDYKALDDGDDRYSGKQGKISRAIQMYRNYGRQMYLQNNPAVQQRIMENK